MKKIAFLALTAGFCTFQSCSDKNEPAENKIQRNVTLSGLVYGWTDPPIDTTRCEQLLPGNNSFPKLLFPDDSSFIKIEPANCGDLGECIRYYSGQYQVDGEALHLTFNSNVAVYHVKSFRLTTPYVEVENSEISHERLTRRKCIDHLFFELCDVQGHLMTPKSDTLSKEIQYLKEKRILDKLFTQK